jgi:hypothetical protein
MPQTGRLPDYYAASLSTDYSEDVPPEEDYPAADRSMPTKSDSSLTSSSPGERFPEYSSRYPPFTLFMQEVWND